MATLSSDSELSDLSQPDMLERGETPSTRIDCGKSHNSTESASKEDESRSGETPCCGGEGVQGEEDVLGEAGVREPSLTVMSSEVASVVDMAVVQKKRWRMGHDEGRTR